MFQCLIPFHGNECVCAACFLHPVDTCTRLGWTEEKFRVRKRQGNEIINKTHCHCVRIGASAGKDLVIELLQVTSREATKCPQLFGQKVRLLPVDGVVGRSARLTREREFQLSNARISHVASVAH